MNLLYWSYTKGNPSQVIFTHGTRVFRRWCSHVKWMFLKLCLCFIPFRFKAKETLNAERMFSNLISCWKTFNILTTSHHLHPVQTHLSGLFLLFLVTDFLSFFLRSHPDSRRRVFHQLQGRRVFVPKHHRSGDLVSCVLSCHQFSSLFLYFLYVCNSYNRSLLKIYVVAYETSSTTENFLLDHALSMAG